MKYVLYPIIVVYAVLFWPLRWLIPERPSPNSVYSMYLDSSCKILVREVADGAVSYSFCDSEGRPFGSVSLRSIRNLNILYRIT